MRSAALLPTIVLLPTLLACGGVDFLAFTDGLPTDSDVPVVLPEEPVPEGVPTAGALEGYGYVPGPPTRFTRFSPGDEVFVGVDGANLRVSSNPESDVILELPHGKRVTVLETLDPPAQAIGRTNAWVRVKTESHEGVLFGALLTPFGGEGFNEGVGDYRWTVTWSKDFHPLVRLTGSEGTHSLVLQTTERFQGGTLDAEQTEWGDFDVQIDVTQCAVGARPEGPRCSTGSAVTNGPDADLRALTPVDAYRFTPGGPAETPSCTDAPVVEVQQPASALVVRTVTLPSYMRGPTSDIPCRGMGTLTSGDHKGQTVIACSVEESGKEWPPRQSTHWFVDTADGAWARLNCMGPVNGELEQHLGHDQIAVNDTLGIVLAGSISPPPEVLHTTSRGKVTTPHHWPGELPKAEIEQVFEHDTLGRVFRARKGASTAPWGLLIPRQEGGFVQYTWEPDLSDLTLDGVPSPGRYDAVDAMGDWFAYGVKKVDLTKVGTAGGGDVYSLRADHPLQAVFAKLHEDGPNAEPLPDRPWLFVDGPFGGFYAIMKQGVARPFAGEPILYAYADAPTPLSIRFGEGLQVRGTYPRVTDGWDVTVLPGGRLLHEDERLDRLFWDGASKRFGSPETGWIVRGDELETVLEERLPMLGLSEHEASEAIDAWLPLVAGAPWVRVGVFPRSTIDAVGPLDFEPKPDSLIRVWVELTPLEEFEGIEPPVVDLQKRRGLTVVEWGYILR